jgi:hypothetical protein
MQTIKPGLYRRSLCFIGEGEDGMAGAEKKWIFFSLFVIFSSFFLVFFIPFKENCVFINNETNQVAAYLPLAESSFQIKYTHTIHLSDVIESYRVLQDNSLMATELEYEDFNIGMPSNAEKGERFVEKDGKYFIKDMQRKMPEFRLFIGDVEMELSLLTEHEKFDLKQTLERGTSYTVKVQRLSIFQQLKGENLSEQESAA